jgi:hypothetical protein
MGSNKGKKRKGNKKLTKNARLNHVNSDSDVFSSNDESQLSRTGQDLQKRRHEDRVQDTLHASGINAEGNDYFSRKVSHDMGHDDQDRYRAERMEQLSTIPAAFEDLKKIIFRRSKIEQWVDEPFFTKTIKNTLVRIGFSQMYRIAEIVNVKDDPSAPYTLTNGKKTGIYVQLLLTEQAADKLKWFRLV